MAAVQRKMSDHNATKVNERSHSGKDDARLLTQLREIFPCISTDELDKALVCNDFDLQEATIYLLDEISHFSNEFYSQASLSSHDDNIPLGSSQPPSANPSNLKNNNGKREESPSHRRVQHGFARPSYSLLPETNLNPPGWKSLNPSDGANVPFDSKDDPFPSLVPCSSSNRSFSTPFIPSPRNISFDEMLKPKWNEKRLTASNSVSTKEVREMNFTDNHYHTDDNGIRFLRSNSSAPSSSSSSSEYELHCKELRDIALKLSRSSEKHSREAKRALDSNDMVSFKNISKIAEEEKELSGMFNAQAAQNILLLNNEMKCRDLWEIDLHHLHANEAIILLKERIQKIENFSLVKSMARKKNVSSNSNSSSDALASAMNFIEKKEIFVITGRGNHSKGGEAVLRNKIFSFLLNEGYSVRQVHDGMFAVKPKKRWLQ